MRMTEMTAVELSAAIRAGQVTAVEAVEEMLAGIEERDALYNCYVTVDREGALAQAQAVQAQIGAGELTGPLAGVPVAVKDNLCTKGLRTTCASRMLENFVPTYTAEAVVNLRKAGAVILGKTNMDEFAMGSTTETSAYGVTRNPWNREHVPGGSSGGSAAAVAAGECICALGSDTGGSIRQPAAYCGMVGMKPTYGTVSRYGLIAYGSSLDQIGPLTKDVRDCAAVLEAIASHDVKDSTSLQRQDTDFMTALTEDVQGMRIGIPNDYLGEGLDEDVRAAVLKAAAELAGRGAVVERFDLSLVEYAIPAYYTIAAAEASSNLERFDGIKYGHRTTEDAGLHSMYRKSRSEGFGEEVKRRIMLGSFVLSSGYYDAYYLNKDRRTASKGMERVYINVGKRDGFFAGNLIEVLNTFVPGKRVDVGRIDLLPSYSLFDVKKSDAKRIVGSLKGADFMGKRLFSEIASQDKDYAKASTRRSKERNNQFEDSNDPYDAFEVFKKKSRRKGKK